MMRDTSLLTTEAQRHRGMHRENPREVLLKFSVSLCLCVENKSSWSGQSHD